VSTVEQKFRLKQAFEETTMDGRIVRTTASRKGDVLVLDQRGDLRFVLMRIDQWPVC
jgi:hypothetical protein